MLAALYSTRRRRESPTIEGLERRVQEQAIALRDALAREEQLRSDLDAIERELLSGPALPHDTESRRQIVHRAIHEIRSSITALTASSARLSAEVTALRDSRSWKLTAPLRFGWRVLHRSSPDDSR
jgi:hypothetical protein